MSEEKQITSVQAPLNIASVSWSLYFDEYGNNSSLFGILADWAQGCDPQLHPWDGVTTWDGIFPYVSLWRAKEGCLHIQVTSINVERQTMQCKVTSHSLPGLTLTHDGVLELSYSDVESYIDDGDTIIIRITNGISWDDATTIEWIPMD